MTGGNDFPSVSGSPSQVVHSREEKDDGQNSSMSFIARHHSLQEGDSRRRFRRTRPKENKHDREYIFDCWYSVRLFERDETGGVRGTDTGSTVLDGLAVEVKQRLERCIFTGWN